MFESRFLSSIAAIYQWLIKLGSNFQSLFLLYMRIVWGHQLFMSGLWKLGHMEQFIQFLNSLHIVAPEFHGYLISFLETLCGLCLFAGFASRLAAIPVIAITLTALATSPTLVDLEFLFKPLLLVREEPYPFLLTAVIVLVFGPGRVSIDAWIKRRLEPR